MITKVSCRPYASGVNSTQNQKQKVNFGMNPAEKEAVGVFADVISKALAEPTELLRHARVDAALQSLRLRIEPRTSAKELLDAVLKTMTGSP